MPDVIEKIRCGISRDRGYGFKASLAAVLCCLCIHAEGAVLTVTVSVPQQEDFSDVPLLFQKFDPSQGKLTSVEIILQATGQLTQAYENVAHRSSSARMRQTMLLSLTLADAKSALVTATQTEKHTYSEDSFDGLIDFSGTSGETATYDLTASDQTLLQSKKNLAMFTGSDLVELDFSSDSSYHIAGKRNGRFGVDALAGAEITVIYNYSPVPESAWFGGAAGVCALMCAFRFRMRSENRTA